MEKSCNSSLIKAVPSKETSYSCTEEESGWTAYFEDFSNNNNKRKEEQEQEEQEEQEGGGAQSFGYTSSLVSDAASGAAWKLASHNNQSNAGSIGVPPNNFPRKLSFKKTRTKKISGDDLEDTASSPVNSPKIGDLRPVDINPRKIDDHHMNMNSLGNEGTTVEHFAEIEQAHDEKSSDCTDLKNKGFCLVPMSWLVNYIG